MRCIALTLAASLVTGALAAEEPRFGEWKDLFNGKDLAGWQDRDGKPCSWKVRDGAMTNQGGPMVDVATVEWFGDYELEVEYRNESNSGVYLRGQVEVQVNSTAATKADKDLNPGDLGAIYSVAPAARNPQWKPGEWNKFRIVHVGNRVHAWHNDVLIQDGIEAPKATGGSMLADPGTLACPTGPIMIQGDHGVISVRKVRLRHADTWKPLWNGKDLTELTIGGGRKIEEFWGVKDGALTTLKWGGTGGVDIHTAKPYGNFVVHYEYRSGTAEGGNSGFYLRDQWEIQILREQSTTNKHGDAALYSHKAPAVQARRPDPDAWNTIVAKVDGMKIWVWQNGKLIHDAVELPTRTDNHGVETKTWSKKPFKLQGDHGQVWFRNLFLKDLPDSP